MNCYLIHYKCNQGVIMNHTPLGNEVRPTQPTNGVVRAYSKKIMNDKKIRSEVAAQLFTKYLSYDSLKIVGYEIIKLKELNS